MILEFPASALSATEVVQRLQQQGCLLLRQALNRDWLTRWHPAFERCFERADQRQQSGQMSEQEYHSLYSYGHPGRDDLQAHSRWQKELLQELAPLVHALHGEELCLLTQNSLPRRQRCAKPEYGIPWHQDQEFSGPLRSGFNFWVPLSPAGGRAPGLELWPHGPLRPYLHLQMSNAEREALCQQIPEAEIWRPELQVGDLLIFHYFILHRSYFPPQMKNTRISYELRLAAYSELRNSGIPFIVCAPDMGI